MLEAVLVDIWGSKCGRITIELERKNKKVYYLLHKSFPKCLRMIVHRLHTSLRVSTSGSVHLLMMKSFVMIIL
jgi:hypothetical protein